MYHPFRVIKITFLFYNNYIPSGLKLVMQVRRTDIIIELMGADY